MLKYYFLPLFILSPLLFASPELSYELKPNVKVVRLKPDNCQGKGANFQKLFVSSKVKDEKIEVWLFVQKYDAKWLKKVYKLDKSGIIETNFSSCEFTGNYMSVAFYSEINDTHDLNLSKVAIIHNARGNKPKFRVTKRRKLRNEYGGGVSFEEGEVFTPKGEAVELVLFMEKKDGSWRKKHFDFIGSGKIKLNIIGKDLTGRYKSHLVVKKDYTKEYHMEG